MSLKGKQNNYLYKRGDTYWIRASRVGKTRLNKSLNTNDIVLARELRDKEISAYFSDEVRQEKVIYIARDKFLEWWDGNRKWRASTKNHIKFIWDKHLCDFFGNMHLDEIDSYAWETYMNKKIKENHGRRFYNERKYLRMFLQWAVQNNFKQDLKKWAQLDEDAEGRAYTDEEISDLFLHAGYDLHLQIQMALTMGMRKSEILSLEWWQVDFENGTIHLPKEKTKIKKARTFKATTEVLSLLLKRKSTAAGSSNWVWPSPKDPTKSVGLSGNKSAWTTCKKNAGIKGKFHWLRHTFLTKAFKTSTNPLLVCDYAGLSIEVAQKVYLHFDHNDTKSVAGLVGF